MKIPRILFAGTASGCGKTTAVCTVLRLLQRRAADIRAYKCGPDYIDPMFHRDVSGIPTTNLDPFFCNKEQLCHLLCQNAGASIHVIEGVMGYYDGTGKTGTDNSTFSVADKTETPVVLVVDGEGAAASLLATIEGFSNFVPNSRICGVLFNRMRAGTYQILCRLMHERFGESIVPVGYIPIFDEAYRLPSRHLGLVTSREIADLQQRMDALADMCAETIDTERIIALADSAAQIENRPVAVPRFAPIHLAYAYDAAFCFYYHDTLSLFEKMGAVLLPFSPLKNEPIPAEADGLLLGGGYPELYARRLAENRDSAESVCTAIKSGMPAIAECGGFQYLGKALDAQPMCGVLEHESTAAGKLVRFGYVTLTARKGGVFGEAGTRLKGHEFHYWDSTQNGADFVAENLRGAQYPAAVTTETLYAGFPHLYLYACIPAAESFYRKCLEYQKMRNSSVGAE
ncbi:MAG: cobyrinate a,c-diamide synthase [Clostridia bacterium]|nr:cobyrinate a,c-diamide synthase [Clostridia bacterium]